MRRRVVIIGGGFGGLYAARALKRAPVDVTLVDRRNHHLFQPLLSWAWSYLTFRRGARLITGSQDRLLPPHAGAPREPPP